MAVTVSNILAGPATLWTAAFGTAEPISAAVALGAGWTDLGGTDGGARVVVNQAYTNLTVDQIAGPVGARKTDQTITVATSLAEATLANLRLALNDGGTGDTMELGQEVGTTEPTYKAIAIQGAKPGGGTRRIYIRRALSTESVELAWTKDGKTMIPVTFTGYYVSSSIKAIKIDDGTNTV